jgi:hypothetical protein
VQPVMAEQAVLHLLHLLLMVVMAALAAQHLLLQLCCL